MNRYFRHYFGGPTWNYRGRCCCEISKQSVKLDISPLVSRVGGQVGCLKKQNSSRILIFYVSAAVFHLKLKNLGWFFGWFFEVCSILTEKQRLKPRKSNSLMNFASLDTQLDHQLARLVEIYPVLHFVLKFSNSSAPYNFLWDLQSNV